MNRKIVFSTPGLAAGLQRQLAMPAAAAAAPMRAAVVGGGIGGLVTAAALRRAGVSAVVYAEPTVHCSGSPIDTVGSLGLGLWTNALRCLELLEPKALDTLGETGRWMGDASYRARDGRWIAGPSSPLAQTCAPGKPAMLFVSHSELQLQLESLLPAEAIIQSHSRVRRFDSSSSDGAGLRLVFEDGSSSEESYDLIVGADGRHSVVRQQLVLEKSARQLMQWPPAVGERRLASGDPTPHSLQNMGYVVFRGLASGAELPSLEGSFQSWGGDGYRFAAVPMCDSSVVFHCKPETNNAQLTLVHAACPLKTVEICEQVQAAALLVRNSPRRVSRIDLQLQLELTSLLAARLLRRLARSDTCVN